jgi:hypothetical protein
MCALSDQDLALVMSDVRKERQSAHFSEDDVMQAIESVTTIFRDFEQIFVPGMCHVKLKVRGI